MSAPCRDAGRNHSLIGIRPEHLQLADPGQGNVETCVTVVAQPGNITCVCRDRPAGQRIVEAVPGLRLHPGNTAGIGFDSARMHAFDGAGLALAALCCDLAACS